MPPKRRTPVPTKQWFEPEGAGPVKRTPKSHYDGVVGKGHLWEVHRIIGERVQQKEGGSGTETRYLVKWKDVPSGPLKGTYSDAKYDTWEPIGNMPGCEDLIHHYQQTRDGANAEADAEETRVRLEKVAARRGSASASSLENGAAGAAEEAKVPLGGKKGVVSRPAIRPARASVRRATRAVRWRGFHIHTCN
jgi:hypothetical protein